MALKALLFVFLTPCCLSKISMFDDSVMYSFSWKVGRELEDKGNIESIIVRSKENEMYQCLLPRLEEDQEEQIDPADGPHPLQLLQALRHEECSYKLESYWVYELCYGRYLRQYHEEQAQQSNKPNARKLTEYYLGKFKLLAPRGEEAPIASSSSVDEEEQPTKVSTLTVQGRTYPYYGVDITDGTPCDLEGHTARRSTIKYICNEMAINEILLLVEIKTCEYEVIVATALLCKNRAYIPKKDIINDIECHAMDGSPRYPRVMKEYAKHESWSSQSKDVHASGGGFDVEHISSTQDDPTVVKQFLAGEHCLKGGSGWWHFEVCYGKYVKQFHVEKGGRTDIYLGHWDEQVHKEWYQKKVINRMKKLSGFVLHYYAGGDVCDLTQQPRTVQVKLKCVKDAKPSRVSVSLEEPLSCQYILTVEAAIVCELLETINEYGLFSMPSK